MISLDTAFDSGRGGDEKDWDGSGIWEDEDAKGFYEDLPNLRDFVPVSFFSKCPPQANGGNDPSPAPEADVQEFKVVEDVATAEVEVKEEDDVEGEDADDSNPSSSSMENLLLRLPLALERSSIDQIAVDFTLISTKNSRKRLIKALLAVPRQRTDLLPFYSRLAAILSREVFKDIGSGVVDQLEKDFHHHVKKGKTDQAGFFIEVCLHDGLIVLHRKRSKIFDSLVS
jgi:regulator of nonsense transcripts 2